MLQLQLDIGKKNEIITIICIVMIKNGLNVVNMCLVSSAEKHSHHLKVTLVL